MRTIKDILNFCNKAIFFDFTNQEIISEFNQVRKFLINRFHRTIPNSRIIIMLSIIDKIILNIFDGDIDDILKDIHDLRENIMYMLSFEKVEEEEIETDDSDEEN